MYLFWVLFYNLINIVVGFTLIVTWLAGIVLASGFWSTFFAIILMPYAWYLVVERIVQSIF